MTGLGIFILVVCAIGVYSVSRWVFDQLVKLNQRYLVNQPGQHQKPKMQKFIRIGHGRKLVCYDDLPDANKYSGRTWLGGLPVRADVIVPSKYNYATVVYMDHWFKQWVYDVMLTFPTFADSKWIAYQLFFPMMFIIAGFSAVKVLPVTVVIYAYLLLWYLPSGMPMERRSAENAKNLTPDDWRKIYNEVAESREREDGIVRAIRRSGIH